MRTLLPKNEIRHNKHEYRLRWVILMLFFLSAAVWIGIISLFPAYIFSAAQGRNASDESVKINNELLAGGNNQIAAEAQDANTVIHAVASTQDSLFFSSLIEDIDARRVPGMIITNFNLSHTTGGTGSDSKNTAVNASTISISGMAATRDILVAFEQNLENDPRLTKVELPVSALAENTNINFTMSMQGIQ
jgi:Tfp pilus assembly protein PilN